MSAPIQIPLDRWRERGRVYVHRGHPIFYLDEGQGPALVCLHGFPTASWDWNWLWPALTRRFRAIAPDFIGFGLSEKPRRHPYSLFDQADLVEGLLGALGVESAFVLAHDYGDTVAQELLARRLEEPARRPALLGVCLLNGGIYPDAVRPLRVQTLLAGPLGLVLGRLLGERRFRRSFSAIFAPQARPGDEALETWWALLTRQGGRAVTHRVIRYMHERRRHAARWTGALARTRVPLRLVVGAHDPISGRAMADRFRAAVPAPDVVVLEEAGHCPQVEAPRATLAAALAHFERA